MSAALEVSSIKSGRKKLLAGNHRLLGLERPLAAGRRRAAGGSLIGGVAERGARANAHSVDTYGTRILATHFRAAFSIGLRLENL